MPVQIYDTEGKAPDAYVAVTQKKKGQTKGTEISRESLVLQ
jgi:hypothetical protein